MLYKTDPRQLLEARERQVTYLARYGRQPMLQWDDVPVSEFNRLHAALAALIGRENEATKAVEDR